MYDHHHPWPASTVCSEAAPLHEVDDDEVDFGPQELNWTGTQNERTWISEPTAQLAPMSGGVKGKGVVDRTRHNPTLDTEVRFWMPSKPLPKLQPYEDQPADDTVLSEEELEQQAVEREEQLVARLAALRLPTLSRRKQTVVQPSASSSYVDTEPLLSSHEGHVPFDPVDPYHHSGQPKKKTLYGPEGYLGKKKDWKQSPLQKMVSRVASVGTRVVRHPEISSQQDKNN